MSIHFFNNIENLFNFFVELNSYLQDSYETSFINPCMLNFLESGIRGYLKSDSLLKTFREHFNHFSDYDKFISKDVEFYKDILLNEIVDCKLIPVHFKKSFKENINKIFDNGYLEEDHINTLYDLTKEIIRGGLEREKEEKNSFKADDERWYEL